MLLKKSRILFNSLSGACMWQWIRTRLGQIMAFCLFWRQAIIWSNGDLSSIAHWGNYDTIESKYNNFNQKMNLKMPSAKWRPFCFGTKCINISFRVNETHYFRPIGEHEASCATNMYIYNIYIYTENIDMYICFPQKFPENIFYDSTHVQQPLKYITIQCVIAICTNFLDSYD